MLRKFTLLICFSIIFISSAFCDTTDYFHVFYNKIKIKDVSISLPLQMKKADIKENDTLSVEYWDDTPCATCKFFLVVIDNKNNYVKVSTNIGQGEPLIIPMSAIMLWSDNKLVNTFDIYYYEEKPAFPIHLFTLKLQ